MFTNLLPPAGFGKTRVDRIVWTSDVENISRRSCIRRDYDLSRGRLDWGSTVDERSDGCVAQEQVAIDIVSPTRAERRASSAVSTCSNLERWIRKIGRAHV